MTATTNNPAIGIIAHWRDYLELCKPKVVALMVFTAIVGMLLADPGHVQLATLFFGTLGIGLVASSAAAINQAWQCFRSAGRRLFDRRHRHVHSD